METIHCKLQNLSLQQDALGQLPRGLLREIQDCQKLAKKFTTTLGPSKAIEVDRKVSHDANRWPEEIVIAATKNKFYSLWLPKALGGGGLHPLSMYGFNFEMASYCLGITNLVGAHYVGLGLVSSVNAFSVMKKIISDIRQAEKDGGHCVVSTAITEPNAGSDLEDEELIRTAKVCSYAQRVKGGYLLNGQKIFISNSAFAKWHMVSAFEDLQSPSESLVLLAIPAGTKGLSLGRFERKLGQHASPTNVLFFEDVFVPDELVCFSRSQFKNRKEYLQYSAYLLNDVLSLSRAGVGCMSSGVLKKTLDLLVEYAEIQTLNGKKLADHEWVQSLLGKIAQNYIVAKTVSWEGHVECYSRGPYNDLQKPVVYNFMQKTPEHVLTMTLGSWLVKDEARTKLRTKRLRSATIPNEKLISGWGSLVKSVCSDLAVESLTLALDLAGNSGGTLYWQLEKMLRDAKLLQIYEGTNELNRLMTYKNFVGSSEHIRDIFRE